MKNTFENFNDKSIEPKSSAEEGADLMAEIEKRAKEASPKIQERISKLLANFKKAGILSRFTDYLDEIHDDFPALVKDPNNEISGGHYKGWEGAEIQELYSVLYGKILWVDYPYRSPKNKAKSAERIKRMTVSSSSSTPELQKEITLNKPELRSLVDILLWDIRHFLDENHVKEKYGLLKDQWGFEGGLSKDTTIQKLLELFDDLVYKMGDPDWPEPRFSAIDHRIKLDRGRIINYLKQLSEEQCKILLEKVLTKVKKDYWFW